MQALEVREVSTGLGAIVTSQARAVALARQSRGNQVDEVVDDIDGWMVESYGFVSSNGVRREALPVWSRPASQHSWERGPHIAQRQDIMTIARSKTARERAREIFYLPRRR